MNGSTPAQTLSQDVWQRPFVKTYDTWCGDFVLELRLRDVPGPVIGERLAEVEGHCAETGESPSEAFGEPTDYAARIEQGSSPERVPGVWKVAVAAAFQVLAMIVGTSAVRSWAGGESLTYNLGQVLCLALTLLALLSLPLLVRRIVRRPWTFGFPLIVAVHLGVAGAALSGRADLPTVAQLPAPVVAIGLFVAVLVLARVEYRELAADAEDDLVTSPLTVTPGQPETAGRPGRRTALLPAAVVPAAYIALAALAWLAA